MSPFLMDDEEPIHESLQADEVKQTKTSHEATPKEKDVPDAVIAYSTSSGPMPINYAPPSFVSRN